MRLRLKTVFGKEPGGLATPGGRGRHSARAPSRAVSILLIWLLCSLTSAVHARTVADPLPLETFPGARTLLDQRQVHADYTLALGLFRRSEAQWQAERERRVSGAVVRQTLELPSGFSPTDGMTFYQQQLQRFSPRLLFSCSARECGSSSRWANQHFGVIQLHGLEQYQHYGVYEINHDQRAYYVTLYSVQRGNRRVYMQVDVVAPEVSGAETIASDPDSLAGQLRTQGFFVFPGLTVFDQGGESQVALEPVRLNALGALLEQESGWRIALVGHDYGATDLAGQRRASLRYAQELQAALRAAGIAGARLESVGLGSLAPARRGERSARIEIVLLP